MAVISHAVGFWLYHRRATELKHVLATPVLLLTCVTAALAQPVIDGRASIADGYGAALSVQNTNTQFGDATSGDPIHGNGSEIDQVFGRVTNGRLFIVVAGNLEANFNKLEVFIDSQPGGVNTINGSALPRGVDPFCCGGFPPPDGDNTSNIGALQRINGLTFDTGFHADHYLTFTHGFVTALSPELTFYAASAYYADLTSGTAGRTGALGVQLAPRGLPNVMRAPGNYNDDGHVNAADYVLWRKQQGNVVPRGSGADANGDQLVNDADYNIWRARFGTDTSLSGPPFVPIDLANGVSEALIGPALPNLSQGKLIDKTYAFGTGGATNNAGAGAIARELEFVLPPVVGTNNTASHQNMENIIDLEMAFDSSNVVGVSSAAPYTPTTGNPQAVTTGIEFSVPLSQIGNPVGDIRLVIFVNGAGHDYASNQFAGTGVLDGNLGGNGFGGFTGDLSGINLVDFLGNQFVIVANSGSAGRSPVPEPASILFVLMGAFIRIDRNHCRLRRTTTL